jgi:hypothetical protein
MTYGTDTRPEDYVNISDLTFDPGHLITYQRQRIAQQHEPRRVIWQLVRKLSHALVDFIVRLRDLEALFVDLVFFPTIS